MNIDTKIKNMIKTNNFVISDEFINDKVVITRIEFINEINLIKLINRIEFFNFYYEKFDNEIIVLLFTEESKIEESKIEENLKIFFRTEYIKTDIKNIK